MVPLLSRILLSRWIDRFLAVMTIATWHYALSTWAKLPDWATALY